MVMNLIFGIALTVLSLVVVVLVLLQYGKSKNLSGAIAGGSESFYGKSKTLKKDKILSTATFIVSVVFGLVAIAAYCLVG